MDSVNKTLYIPLYGKAYVSRRGILLEDQKAEQIWEAEGFALKGKSASRWLAYYMAMRAVVFDRWLEERMARVPGALVLHLGCGMDSRVTRVDSGKRDWYDVDFPEVIYQRKRHYAETEHYHMLGSDLRKSSWLDQVSGRHAIVVMEGISMYLRREELEALLRALAQRFEAVELLMDCYTEFAARVSKYKNPINDVGVTQVYGMDDPETLAQHTGFAYTGQKNMTPEELICQLPGMEKQIFRHLYGGRFARKLYRMYEFAIKKDPAEAGP